MPCHRGLAQTPGQPHNLAVDPLSKVRQLRQDWDRWAVSFGMAMCVNSSDSDAPETWLAFQAFDVYISANNHGHSSAQGLIETPTT
jgi:hypothetical protein